VRWIPASFDHALRFVGSKISGSSPAIGCLLSKGADMITSHDHTKRPRSGGEHAQPFNFRERFDAVRATTVSLAAPLSAEDCALQSMPDASPVKWHLAHTTWFFETFVLERYERSYRHFHPRFRVLFNSYYNAVGERHPRPERGLLSRPTLQEIHAYRAHVETRLAPLLIRAEEDAGLAALLELGLQHEQQHQELILTDVKHLLSRNPLQPIYSKQAPPAPSVPRASSWIGCAGGLVEAGYSGADFCFDNETPRHRVFLASFEIGSLPVTQGDFLAFIDNGGYTRPELWLSLGWDAVQAQRWTAPMYWEQQGGRWTVFTLHGRVEVDATTPMAHVSYFEADAYARWAGARLPTEFEWEAVAADSTIEGNFLDTAVLHPLALRTDPPSGKAGQLFGDVWEWTRSAYSPYPGFTPAAGAVGEYNGKFMCNQYVLRGGSCATPRSHLRATYRNFYPPDARWQFAGLRLARDVH
jgi:ergothioneine biosynthesis protein EgtB